MVKNLSASSGDLRDADSIPGSRRSPGGGPGNLLQNSYLENPLDREAWRVYNPKGCKESDMTEAT